MAIKIKIFFCKLNLIKKFQKSTLFSKLEKISETAKINLDLKKLVMFVISHNASLTRIRTQVSIELFISKIL